MSFFHGNASFLIQHQDDITFILYYTCDDENYLFEELMKIRYSKTALKALQGYDKSTQERLRTGITGLTEEPPAGDIIDIGSRGDIYK